MQARKLIRVLSEMIEKDPSVAYMKVCVDARFTNPNHKGDITFKEIPDVAIEECVWNPGDYDVESWRRVVVLGGY